MKCFEPFEKIQPNWPEELVRIKEYLKERGDINVSYSRLNDLYYEFSDEMYSACWMCTNNDKTLEEFADWLSEKDV